MYVVPVAGTYFFGGSWFKNTDNHYTVDYQKNGVTIRRNECTYASGGFSIIPTFLIEDCVVGDQIRLRLWLVLLLFLITHLKHLMVGRTLRVIV